MLLVISIKYYNISLDVARNRTRSMCATEQNDQLTGLVMERNTAHIHIDAMEKTFHFFIIV